MSDAFPKKNISPECMMPVSGMHAQPELTSQQQLLVNEYYHVVEIVAKSVFSKRKIPPTLELQDLISAGVIGLIKAIKKFSEDQNASLKTYVNIRVRGEILDAIRTEWKKRHAGQYDEFQKKVDARVDQALASEMSVDGPIHVNDLLSNLSVSYIVSLDSVMSDQTQSCENIQDMVEAKDEYSVISQLIYSLPKPSIQFVHLFYVSGKTQKEIARILNMSEATICRMHHRILSELRTLFDRVAA